MYQCARLNVWTDERQQKIHGLVVHGTLMFNDFSFWLCAFSLSCIVHCDDSKRWVCRFVFSISIKNDPIKCVAQFDFRFFVFSFKSMTHRKRNRRKKTWMQSRKKRSRYHLPCVCCKYYVFFFLMIRTFFGRLCVWVIESSVYLTEQDTFYAFLYSILCSFSFAWFYFVCGYWFGFYSGCSTNQIKRNGMRWRKRWLMIKSNRKVAFILAFSSLFSRKCAAILLS